MQRFTGLRAWHMILKKKYTKKKKNFFRKKNKIENQLKNKNS